MGIKTCLENLAAFEGPKYNFVAVPSLELLPQMLKCQRMTPMIRTIFY